MHETIASIRISGCVQIIMHLFYMNIKGFELLSPIKDVILKFNQPETSRINKWPFKDKLYDMIWKLKSRVTPLGGAQFWWV